MWWPRRWLPSRRRPSLLSPQFPKKEVEPNVTLTPRTGLVDGQRIEVTGRGFTAPDGFAQTMQCRRPVLSRQDCDRFTGGFIGADARGRLQGRIEVDAIIYPGGGVVAHDCRTGGCSLHIQDREAGFSDALLTPLGFDPDGPLRPPPSMTATPTSDLVDGDLIEMRFRGLHRVGVVQTGWCRAGPADPDDCVLNGAFEEPNTNGTLRLSYPVRTVLRLSAGEEVDCRVSACVAVGVLKDDFEQLLTTPLAFDPDAGVLVPRLRVVPSTGFSDGDQITATVTGAHPADYTYAFHCVAPAQAWEDCDRRHVASLQVGGDEGRDPVGETRWARLAVRRHLRLSGGRTADCARVACYLTMPWGTGFPQARRVLLRFALGAPG